MRLSGTILVLMALAAAATPCLAVDSTETAEPAEVCYATGDVDCNGIITMGDISMIVDYFSLSGNLPACPEQMDMNGDCVINWSDWLLLLHCFDTPVPCEPVETCCDPVLNSSCCVGRTGDANGEGGDEPTIGDISVRIDYLFISRDPSVIPCVFEADVNRSGGCNPTYDDITIGDIGYLIDAMMICIVDCGPPPCLVCP